MVVLTTSELKNSVDDKSGNFYRTVFMLQL